MVIASVVRHL